MSSSPLPARGAVALVTGVQAAGKSTIGALLARRFPRSAFIEGDLMWKLVISGREDMTARPTEEALRQLRLRYRNGAMLADSMAAAGFFAVHADIVMGADLVWYVDQVRTRPLYVIVLDPSVAAVVERQRLRGGRAYRDWEAAEGSLHAAVARFQAWLRETPRLGLWLDTSDETPDETVDRILASLAVASV